SLNVPGQKFEGKVEESTIKGIFEIAPPRFDGEGAPSFPPDFGGREDLKKYLAPEEMIESEHSDIKALAKKTTEGAKNAWEASVRLAAWVHENIPYEIPGGGTALATLHSRKGECGAHSRLHVALCRAVGIPARLVTGGMYTPIYGGSFGQHAWDEVYMGEKGGWVAVDTTAGEATGIDAGHIRLGESATFRPKKVTILDYAPKKKVETAPETAARPAPCKVGETLTYHYLLNGTEIGTEVFRIEKEEKFQEKEAFHVTEKISLQGLEATSRAVLARDGSPLKFHVAGKARGQDYEIDCTFQEREVKVAVQKGEVEFDRTIRLPANVLLFDNNHLGLFTMLLSRLPLKEGATFNVSAFHPSSLNVLPLAVTVGAASKIKVREVEYEAFEVTVKVATSTLTFSVTAEGLIVRDVEAGGRLVVDLERGG
ncbi:MAG: transglutaminase-like domain-containing protein, partial [Planctomycetota bacterium]